MENFRVEQRPARFRNAILFGATFALAGCASLPNSGPTGTEIRKAARTASTSDFPFTLLEVERAADLPSVPTLPAPSALTLVRQPTDLLAPGDVLNVTIYEAGVALFGGSGLRASS